MISRASEGARISPQLGLLHATHAPAHMLWARSSRGRSLGGGKRGHGNGQGQHDSQDKAQFGTVHATNALLDAWVGQQREEHQCNACKAHWQRYLVRRQTQAALQRNI